MVGVHHSKTTGGYRSTECASLLGGSVRGSGNLGFLGSLKCYFLHFEVPFMKI